ncbi:MAG: AAA family ATPase [Gammaproteobacteria bacterium]|nr:AAA family ATPase [Gammaproteobacteria bacterium]
MNFKQALSANQLYTRCDTSLFNFETTVELAPLADPLGQERAIAAINFGVGIPQEGYNLYVLGKSGVGKRHLLQGVIEPIAKNASTPSEWAYLYNFDDPQHPICISLPPGTGIQLRSDLKNFCEELFHAIRAAFRSEVYSSQEKHIEASYRKRENEAFIKLEKSAHKKNIAFLRTENGFAFAPVRDNHVIEPHEFQKLPEDQQRQINDDIDSLQSKLQVLVETLPLWQQEARQHYKELAAKTARLAVSYLIDNLKDKYHTHHHLTDFFNRIEQDIVDNIDVFRRPEVIEAGISETTDPQKFPPIKHYQINLLTDRSSIQGAPVHYVDHPTHDNLIGKTEYLSHMGTLVTDYTLIRPGALHHANGGYLIIDAHKLLTQAHAWEALKRALTSGEIVIQSLAQDLGLISTVSLEPEPIPLRTKVILLGERDLYYLLAEHDPDFEQLFKVAVDVEDQIARTADNTGAFAKLIASVARQHHLLPFHRSAVARIIEHSARHIEHAHKISIHMGLIIDVMVESSYWAKLQKASTVDATHVETAIRQQDYRHGRIPERLQEGIIDGTTLIDTTGSAIGQINALTVIGYGSRIFGLPSRVTATARAGDGKLLDIEHEADLGGEIHTKGVLIFSHFMAARYATHKSFSVSASVGFEQSYGGVEGDSASAAELCAVLSAIANIPLKQNLAVTGSINQHGMIQVIGGINEKIEGFFDICVKRGLTGDQGVIVPRHNIQHLMLKQEVITAVEQEKFHIFAVDHIDEMLELFTGMSAGQRDENGEFPEDSFNYAVEEALIKMAEQIHPPDSKDDDEDEEDEDEEDEEKNVSSDDSSSPEKTGEDKAAPDNDPQKPDEQPDTK